MRGAALRYRELLIELSLERGFSGGVLADSVEAERASQLDRCWRFMSDSEQDDAERWRASGLAMSASRLAAYLSLEREMLALAAVGDPLAERLRDAMDPIWYSLTDDEHARLNARKVPASSATGSTPRARAKPGSRR
jgi:hypothetical protein